MDEVKLLPVFAPEVEKGQLANIPSYNFYMKINALQPQVSFSGEIEDFIIKTDNKVKEKIVHLSQSSYGQTTISSHKGRPKKISEKRTSSIIEKPKNLFEQIK